MGDAGNLAATLADAYDGRLDAAFLTVPGESPVTYGAVDDRAARMAGALRDAGAAPGDRVLVQVAKSPDAVALYLACLRGGFVHVPLNPALTIGEVGDLARDAQPAVGVVDPAFVTDVAALDAIPELLTLDPDGHGSLADATVGAGPAGVADRHDDELAAILYTSGTTGRPKGAMLTHANLRHNAGALHDLWGFGPDDVLVHVLPVFHVHGLFVALHCALLSAIPVWFLRRFDAAETVALLRSSTAMMGVPTHYERLLAEPGLQRPQCENMRLFTVGSAPLAESTFVAFESRTGHRLCERYGMSETGIITANPPGGASAAGTGGMPLPEVEVRVTVDEEVVPAHTTGMVEVRGPNVFAGYWRDDRASAAAIRPGDWFVTGDVGRLDADGRLTLEGRAGDVIISGGENLYPRELELAIDGVPGVADAAVIGVPHPDLGEAAVALVVTAPGHALDETAVRAALDGTLARYKHPRRILAVDELPRNTMGKVQKHVLRATWAGLFDDD